MPLHITLALLALLHATRIFAQSCPPDSPSFSVTNSTYDGDIVQDLCCESPITVTGGGSCEVLTRRSNGAAGPDTFTYLCSFSSYGTISIAANTFVRRMELQLLGGLGGTLEYAHLGGQPKCVPFLSFASSSFPLSFTSLDELISPSPPSPLAGSTISRWSVLVVQQVKRQATLFGVRRSFRSSPSSLAS